MKKKLEQEPAQEHSSCESDHVVRYEFTASSPELAQAEAVRLFMMQEAQKKQKRIEAFKRPHIGLSAWILGLLLPVVLVACAIITSIFLDFHVLLTVAAVLLICFVFAKSIVVLSVLLYQKIAPMRLRMACLFEPTCSEYMLLAIKKYGFWRGFFKGIRRISRCHFPNGGKDYP